MEIGMWQLGALNGLVIWLSFAVLHFFIPIKNSPVFEFHFCVYFFKFSQFLVLYLKNWTPYGHVTKVKRPEMLQRITFLSFWEGFQYIVS